MGGKRYSIGRALDDEVVLADGSISPIPVEREPTVAGYDVESVVPAK